MPTYAIGDIQGCFDELCRLLDTLRFDPARDQLWFCGDLVNRGPQSVETLRFVKELGAAAVVVLGNHDLHLLAVAHYADRLRPADNFMDVLEAYDRYSLFEWLRAQPLLHHDDDLGYTLVHAGLPPQWDLAQAQACAREVEAALQGPHMTTFFEHMYGNGPACWRDDLSGWKRLRFITNCLTRVRYCDAQGNLALKLKDAPGRQPAPYLPWFEVPGRKSTDLNIIFGHWSTLGRHAQPGVVCLDSGCVWGGQLTALRLDDGHWFSVSCEGACAPGED